MLCMMWKKQASNAWASKHTSWRKKMYSHLVSARCHVSGNTILMELNKPCPSNSLDHIPKRKSRPNDKWHGLLRTCRTCHAGSCFVSTVEGARRMPGRSSRDWLLIGVICQVWRYALALFESTLFQFASKMFLLWGKKILLVFEGTFLYFEGTFLHFEFALWRCACVLWKYFLYFDNTFVYLFNFFPRSFFLPWSFDAIH